MTFAFFAGLAALGILPALDYMLRLLGSPGFWWPLPDSNWPPVVAAFVLMTGTLAFLLPERAWKARLAALAEARLAPRTRRMVGQVAALAIGVALLAHWHKVRGLVGDAAVWTPLASKWFIFGSEPLGRWSHYFAYQFLAAFGMASGEAALRLSSYCAGAVFLWGLVRFLPALVPPGRAWSATVILACAPVSIFFFGYPSTCPWAYSLIAVYLLAGLHYLATKPRRAPWPETLLIGIAVWAHGLSLFATGAQAALILLWLFTWPRALGLATWVRRLLVAACLSVIPFMFLGATLWWSFKHGPGIAGYGWQGNAQGGIFHRTWVVFSGGNRFWSLPGHKLLGDGTYAFEEFQFLGRDYDVGVLNVMMYLFPGILLVPVAARWLARKDWRQAVFLGAGLAGLLVNPIFWNPDYGYQTDMRTLSMFARPAGYFLVLWLAGVLDDRRWSQLAVLAASATFAFGLVPYLSFP